LKLDVLILYLALLTLYGCDYFKPKQTKEIIAVVNDHVLYSDDIKKVLPNNLSEEDSIIFVKSFIDDWAMDNILMDNAKFNLPLQEQQRYEKMVEKYRSELFKKAYLDALIQKEIEDNIIDSLTILAYYEANKNNFKLNENLIKIRYIYTNNSFKDLSKIKQSFRRFQAEDINYLLDNELKFDKIELNDSVWVKTVDVFNILDGLSKEQQNKIISDRKYIEFKDTVGTLFVQVKDLLKPDEIAPFSYVKPTIEQILRNKEKLKIKAELERKILNDAIKDKTYEVLK
jgi:hypothetical protein